jgi:DNA-binding PadR family transcriptional regulator
MATLTEPSFWVLTALASEPQHGYAILTEVKALSGGQLSMHAGTLYAILERLQKNGFIEIEREEVVQSRLRRYYRLTAVGVSALSEETQRLKRSASVAAHRLAQRPATGGAA